MTRRSQTLGRWGETAAADFLVRHGYTVLERNARTPYGELDLVVFVESGALPAVVFVEVKTRASDTLGPPEISITGRKRAHLLAAAQAYLQSHPDLPSDWRVDVVSISGAPGRGEPEILHFENVFTSC
jgi:putative endonuclease